MLLTPAEALRDYPQVVATEADAVDVGHGKVLERGDRFVGDGPWAVVDATGRLLAVYGAHRGTTVKPEVVVAPAGEGPARARRPRPDAAAEAVAPPSSVEADER